MTKVIDNKVLYIDDANDIVGSQIEEIRSSVSYELNVTTEILTLNTPLDYEIKEKNGNKYYVYGYPDKWELDYKQGNGILEGMNISAAMSGNCAAVGCLNLLYMAGILPDIKQSVSRLGFNPTSKGRKSKIELKKTA